MEGVVSMHTKTSLDRRQFLQALPAAVGMAHAAPEFAGVPPGKRPRGIPSYLPDRLAICYIGWEWITEALPDEPYGDVERMLQEVKHRGFNCVRAEMGLNWMFDLAGRRRGKMKFRGWIDGASSNLQCHAYTKGGGEHDVFERVMRLFQLADKYDIYVITTSWEYQDALSHVDDVRIRDEIVGVPYNDRLMLLAAQYNRLIEALKRRKLAQRIAFVEVINEYNYPPIFCAAPGASRQTFAEWIAGKSPTPACSNEQIRERARQAVAFLRERHPDLLITVDYGSALDLANWAPANVQVADHHVYSDGLTQAFWKAAGIDGIRPGKPPEPEKSEFLRRYLKRDRMSWEEIVRRGPHVHEGWLSIAWLYENLDNAKFDEWCLAHHAEYKQRILDSMREKYEAAAAFARARNLPLVVDEGGIIYPPQKSRFVMTAEGRADEEAFSGYAIATGHWGILPTGYTRPDNLTWHDESQIAWLQRQNRRILETKTHTMGAQPFAGPPSSSHFFLPTNRLRTC